MRANDGRQMALLRTGKARHVHVFQQIAAMLVVLVVRDVHAHFVQQRRPTQQSFGGAAGECAHALRVHSRRRGRIGKRIPGDGFEHASGGCRNAPSVASIHMVALRQIVHRRFADVLGVDAPEQIVQQPFAQRALGDGHRVHAERIEDRRRNGDSASEHGGAFGIHGA